MFPEYGNSAAFWFTLPICLQEKAKSEGATPVGSPRKWMVEGEGKETRERVGLARKNLDDILSSDDDQATDKKVNIRPRQRPFRQRAKQEFTNEPTPEQLVRNI